MLAKLLEICENLKEEIYSDNNLKDYYFELKYEEKAILRLVKIYRYHDDHDRIRHKKEYGKSKELQMTLKEYSNLLIDIYEWKLMMGATGAIQTERILKRIKIQKIN